MVNSRNERTSSQREPGHTDTTHTTANDVDTIWLKCGVDVIPNEPSANVGCVAVRVVNNIVEPRHRDLDALCGRESRIGRMATSLDLAKGFQSACGLHMRIYPARREGGDTYCEWRARLS